MCSGVGGGGERLRLMGIERSWFRMKSPDDMKCELVSRMIWDLEKPRLASGNRF